MCVYDQELAIGLPTMCVYDQELEQELNTDLADLELEADLEVEEQIARGEDKDSKNKQKHNNYYT